MTGAPNDVVYVKNGRIGTLTINRPHARNSLTAPMVMRLYYKLQEIQNDRDVSVLILRGAGDDFCCGADLKLDHEQRQEQDSQSVDMRQFETAVLLHSMRPVTIAAIKGGCAGAGMAWACACDFRIAQSDARFNSAFLDVALAGDMGLPWSLHQIVGGAKAREITLLPGKFDGDEAYRLGLATKVFAPADFEAGLQAFADRLAASAPLALEAIKAHHIEAEKMDFPSFISFETARHYSLFNTEDRVEAWTAFVEKRRPRYKGR